MNGLANDSCLKAAGLKEGDRLLRLDGSLILNQRHFRELSRSLPGGAIVRVTCLSEEQEKQVEVTGCVLPDENCLTEFHGLGIGPKAELSAVRYDSPAELAGCRAGDRIMAINGEGAAGEGRARAGRRLCWPGSVASAVGTKQFDRVLEAKKSQGPRLFAERKGTAGSSNPPCCGTAPSKNRYCPGRRCWVPSSELHEFAGLSMPSGISATIS